jgi:hypothetical protein
MRSWDDYKKTMQNPINLWMAAKANQLSEIVHLVQQGALVDELDHRGYSPLMLAVYAGNKEAAELLLKLGADPNSHDFGGNTILMGAAFKGNQDLVELLLAAGADVHAQNHAGLSALDFARTFGRSQVVLHLQQWGAKSQTGSRFAGFLRILFSHLRRGRGLSQRPVDRNLATSQREVT